MKKPKEMSISFEDSPIPLFEEDFSAVKNRIDELRSEGIVDIPAYFSDHPETVNDFVSLIKVVDLNKAALAIFQASSKGEALKTMNRLLAGNPRTGIAEEIICVAEGKRGFQTETTIPSLKGRYKHILLKWFVAVGHEENLSKVFAIIEDISYIRRTETELLHNYEMQTAINRLLRISLGDFSLDNVLEKALELLLSIPWLTFKKKGCIFVFDSNKGVLRMKAMNGLAKPLIESCGSLPLGKCLCGRAASTRTVQFASSIDERHEIRYDGITPHGHYCIPLIYMDKVLGVINIYVDAGHERDDNEEGFLKTYANALAGIVIRTSDIEQIEQAKNHMQKAFEDTIAALADSVKLRDACTAGHQLRVAELAEAIAKELGLPEDEINGIRTIARVHDIGKLGIPPEILNKPGPLTELQHMMINVHSEAGYSILSKIESPWPLAETVLQHHERLDGSGYPRGLSGDEISKEARIIAVCDVVEAMCSHRPHRAALGVDAALDEISKNQDKLYDREVVQACLKVFSKRGFRFN